MKNLLLLLFACSFITLNAQQRHWQDVDETIISQEVLAKRSLTPDHVRSLTFDFDALKKTLAQAPMEIIGQKSPQGVVLAVPYPDGRNIAFNVVESPNMEAGISKRYPNIKSYKGVGIEDKSRSMRLVLSPLGIHGVCNGPEGPVYLDPYEMGNLEYVQSYFVKDHTSAIAEGLRLGCGTTGKELDQDWINEGIQETASISGEEKGGELVVEKVYRMAIAATGEWTSQLFNSSVEDGLAAMNVSMARINSIWERDLAIRGILIDEEDILIHTTPGSDPYFEANSGGSLLGQNPSVVNNIIGPQSYDFGHVYTANCTDVGGIASLGSVCGPNKAAGVTCHYSSNLDFVTVSIACHEMGHQLSANHTFNNCGENIATGTAYEPGSGSTIMSYCGLCGAQDIQSQADDYYYVSSLEEMYQFIQTGNGSFCGEKIESENVGPEVDFPYEDDFYIPIETPFYIEANGFDANGDELKYNFEQYNLGPISPLGDPIGNAPSFRSIYPSEDNFRYFPNLESVIENESSSREVLPTYSRDLNFKVVVRDYNEVIGWASWDEMEFKATDEAGPFLVMAPNTAETLVSGSGYEVQWDVANTDGELVNCQRVNILLSTNGGYDFDMMLAEQVPNDGSHKVVVPDVVSSTARIKIEAANNIFYDMSNVNFNIEAPAAPTYNFTTSPYIQRACLPSVNEVTVSTIAIQNFDSPITLEAIGLPSGTQVTFSENPIMPGEEAVATFDFSGIDLTEYVSATIRGTSATNEVIDQEVIFDIFSNNFSAIELVTPTADQEGVVEVPEFTWNTSINADTYIIEIASSPSFSEASMIETASGIQGSSFYPTVLLPKNVPLYWRVAGTNTCGTGPFTGINVFHTETQSCSMKGEYDLNIIMPASPSIKEHSITFFDDATINDLNIANVNIDYSPVISISLKLKGPDGTTILLFDKECGSTSKMDLGFDDEAPGSLPCPPNTGVRYRPVEELAAFKGKNIKGDWTLIVETSVDAFDPGTFNGWTIEACTNISQAGPQLINNEVLPVRTNDGQVIEPIHLLAEDANNTALELTYTLIDGLEHGDLYLNETKLNPGGTYSQAHINSGRITYFHNGDDVSEDFFHFVISDGEGGFVGKTKFDIDIDENNPVLGTDDLNNRTFNLYPNPATASINIEFIEPVSNNEKLVIFDVQGARVYEEELSAGIQQKEVRVQNLVPGFYIVRRFNASGTFGVNKLIIQR